MVEQGRNTLVHGLLTVVFSSGMAVWAGLCAAAPLGAYLATQKPATLQVDDLDTSMVWAVLLFSSALAVLFGFATTAVLYRRRGALGLLFAAGGGLMTTATGFLIRSWMIDEAHRRADAVEQAMDAIGLPLTDALWSGVDNFIVGIIAVFISIFTLIVDALICMIYLGFQLLVQAPWLFAMSVFWVGGVWLAFAAVSFLVQYVWKASVRTVGSADSGAP